MSNVLKLSLVLLLVSVGARAAEEIEVEDLQRAQKLSGVIFDGSQLEPILKGIRDLHRRYEQMREVELPNSVPPSLIFNPVPVGMKLKRERRKPVWSVPDRRTLPERREDLAFYSVAEMAELIRTRQISSEELTRFHLERLKRYNERLNCVVTLTEDLALAQARRADREIADGRYRGPLHGIPYGVKDLLATRGIRTTWGSAAFTNQVFDADATVVKRLEEAGAVLAAKLTTGELAWDDIWYGGKTRNPWNPEEGSSGSSAGPASATSAGLVPFSIGSETWGSIVSPSTHCGATGLRPTYGRVSRHGAMALSWSMDKIGPICRTVEDCALVFDAIEGPDDLDQTVRDLPFNYTAAIEADKLRVGYLKADFESSAAKNPNDQRSLDALRAMGVNLIPVELPSLPVGALSLILTVESGAAFDGMTRSGETALLQRPRQAGWFREARFVPAVEYLQANRIRYLLIQQMSELMKGVDVIVAPSGEGSSGLVTNLTGHPCVVVPNGFNEKGRPTSISFLGGLYDEARLLAFAKRYQDATGHHHKHPKL